MYLIFKQVILMPNFILAISKYCNIFYKSFSEFSDNKIIEKRMRRQEQGDQGSKKLLLVSHQSVKRIIEADQKIKAVIKQVDEIIDQTIKQINKFKIQAIQLVKSTVYGDILKKQQKISPKLLQNLEKIAKLDLVNIRISEMSEIVSKIDTSKVSNIYQKIGRITQNFKQNIQFNKKKSISFTAEGIKNKEKNSDKQNILFLSKLNMQENKIQQKIIDNNYQQDSNDSIIIQSFQKDRKQQFLKQDYSIIQNLRQSNLSEIPSEDFFLQESKKIEVSNFDNSSEDQNHKDKMKQNKIIKDQPQKLFKCNNKANHIQQNKLKEQCEEVKPLNIKQKKYIKKKIQQQQETQETFYIKLKDVEAEKEKFDAQRRKFNIKLKVLKKIGYTVTKENNLNIKFVGGDETGIVVCFVYFTQLIQQGTIIKMEGCTINFFKNLSYELMSSKVSRASKSTKIDKIQYLRTISKFQNVKNLEYQLVSLTGWPTIKGLGKFYLNNKHKQKNNFNLVVKILQKFPNLQQSNFIDCLITDGSANMPAKIHEQAMEQPKEGQIYYVKNVGIMIQQIGQKDIIYINITKKNQPKKLKQKIVMNQQQLKSLDQIIEQFKKKIKR